MKKFISILGIAALLVACSPQEVHHPSESEIPYAEGIVPVVTVDQTTNQVTFSLPDGTMGLIPVWEFQDKNGDYTVYSARDDFQKIFASAGTYTVRLQVMNAAGLSPDYVEVTFTIDNTIVDFKKYLTFLSGGTSGSGSSKQWRLKGEIDNHFGCGPSGTEGLEWWAAKAYEKESTGIYNDRITFTSEYGYTYNPGEDGCTYVNYGVTASPYLTGQSEDYTFAVDEETTSFSFAVEGDDLYLVLPAGTTFMYIPNDEFVANPRFKILNSNAKNVELVSDNGSIAWNFKITSEEEEKEEVFEGFNYTADSNIWRPADLEGAHTFFYYYAPGWSQIADPETTENNAIGEYALTLPEATTDQWQAQFFIIPVTDIALSSAVNYDFSCILYSSTDHPGVTIKLTDSSDDGNFLFAERISLKAGEEYVFYLTDLAGIDASAVKMVFDFGGNAADTEVSVKKITLKDHSVDDGTVLPSDDDDDDETVTFVDYSSSDNLWYAAKGDDAAHTVFQYYAPDWAQLSDPEITLSGSTYTYSLPTATSSQWQAQLHITPVDAPALRSGTTYDFKVTLQTSTDVKGVTLKLTDTSDDGNFLFTNNVDLNAFEETAVEFTSLTGIDAATVKMVFDFGGNPENTDVTIKEIILQEHTASSSTTSDIDYSSDKNIWKPADSDHTCTYWYAPGWSQIADPDMTQSGSAYTLTLPSATTDQWQAQFFIIPSTDISLSSENTYSFKVTLNSSAAFTGVTIKLTDTTDDGNYLVYDRVTIDETYEDKTFTYTGLTGIDASAVKMVFDFGGNPDNTEITVSDITLWVEDGSSSGSTDSGSDAVNLWESADASHTCDYWYAPGWSQIANPEMTQNGSVYTLTLPSATTDQWQAQFLIIPNEAIALSSSKTYDFSVVINSSTTFTGVTIKLTDASDDGIYLLTERVTIDSAYEDLTFSYTGLAGVDSDAVKMVFDFGGNPDNTEISVGPIVLTEN